MLFLTLVFSALSAFFYRLGGMSKEEAKQKLPFIPSWLVRSWVRDFFCTLLVLIWMRVFYVPVSWWIYLISGALMYGAMTTYWDEISFNKGKDNFFMHGFFIAAALLPFVIISKEWSGYFLRIAVLSIIMGLWCETFSDVDVEEYGRGFLIGLTLPLMLV